MGRRRKIVRTLTKQWVHLYRRMRRRRLTSRCHTNVPSASSLTATKPPPFSRHPPMTMDPSSATPTAFALSFPDVPFYRTMSSHENHTASIFVSTHIHGCGITGTCKIQPVIDITGMVGCGSPQGELRYIPYSKRARRLDIHCVTRPNGRVSF